MSSLARKSMNFMRDVYNLAQNPGEILLPTTTSTSPQNYYPSQGLSSQFNPAYAHQHPLPPAIHGPLPPYHYSYPGPQNAQPYGYWSGPLAPMSPPLPQAALNGYSVASTAPNVHPNTGLPSSPPSPVLSPSIPQPYGDRSVHGVQEHSAFQKFPSAGSPPHHQHTPSWQNATVFQLYSQPHLNRTGATQNLADSGPSQQAAPHLTSSGRLSVSDSSWGVASRLPLKDNIDGRHIASGYMGAPSAISSAPVSNLHSSAALVSASVDSSQLHARGYHEMPAVTINDGVVARRHEVGTGLRPGLPELFGGPADPPSSPAAAPHSWAAPPAELESRSHAIETVELPSPSTTERPRRASRYQRHYSTSTAAFIDGSLGATEAVELDSTPIVAELPATTPATSHNAHHPSPRQNDVADSSRSGWANQAYPGIATLSLSDPPRPLSSLTSPSAHAHTHTRSRSSVVVDQQTPVSNIHHHTPRQQLVSSPVAMTEADRLFPNHARARAKSASLPVSPPYPNPGVKQPAPSYSEPQPQHQQKLPYPLHHGTGTATMPLHHRDYAS